MEIPTPRVFVIGFDGLDYELFDKFNKHKLSLIPLHSPVPVTGPAWTSLYTGDSLLTHMVRDLWGRERVTTYFSNRLEEMGYF